MPENSVRLEFDVVVVLTPVTAVVVIGLPALSNPVTTLLVVVLTDLTAVMPESVYLGEKGKVILRFRIMSNGTVPDAEPQLEGSSGKEPLDRAASSSIRTSSPFEPLPPAFSGPFIELRFIFLYNLPISAAQ